MVAKDIGKFPDAITAAALQRVLGIQVTVRANNEIVGVRIRGLDDILTILDGREVFSTTSRGSNSKICQPRRWRIDIIKQQHCPI